MPDARMLSELSLLRTQFGTRSSAQKRQLISRAGKSSIVAHRSLSAYHDALMFMIAYPDDAALLAFASAELLRIARAMDQTVRGVRRGDSKSFADSGMAGTVTTLQLSQHMTQWLINRFPRTVELDWEDESAGEALDDFLHSLVATVDRDGLLNNRISTRRWLQLARGDSGPDDVHWLTEAFDRSGGTEQQRERGFKGLNLFYRWRLGLDDGSRTFNRFPERTPYYQKRPLSKSIDVRNVGQLPLPRPRRLSGVEREQLLDACRVTLCVRHREIDTLTYVNNSEVHLFNLEGGFDVALFGMKPGRRLPIESYFGFVAARNRVPIGYGGAWILQDRSEIGVNIFDEFRGGESALAFAQVIRVYHQFFNVSRFFVDPYQFGNDNSEAIRSGAFWFYYKLGFRPSDASLCGLAAEERGRALADRMYRTPANVLRKFARGNLLLDLNEPVNAAPLQATVDLAEVGIAITDWIGRTFNGDRDRARQWAVRQATSALSARGLTRWPEPQRRAFEDISLLLGPLMDQVAAWSPREKMTAVSTMRAKGGCLEKTYVQKLQRHARFAGLLADLTRLGRAVNSSERLITP